MLVPKPSIMLPYLPGSSYSTVNTVEPSMIQGSFLMVDGSTILAELEHTYLAHAKFHPADVPIALLG